MGKISSHFFISLDGVVEAPDQWSFPYFNDEMDASIEAITATSSAFLLGRVLYDQWSQYWPAHAEDDFGSYINAIPKYVLSNTLTEATWDNTTILSGDVATQLRALKETLPGDLSMSGSTVTARWLLANGLLDELHLAVHPIAVGHGHRLFEDGVTHPLELVESTTFTTGVLDLTYVPHPKA